MNPYRGINPYGKSVIDASIELHEAALDPHPQYLTAAEGDALFLTPAEGDAAYAALIHVHDTLANIANSVLLGRITAGSGLSEELTPTQVRTLINVEDGSTADQTAAEILSLLITVDGVGSGLDADLLDGLSSASFALVSHNHAASEITSGTLATARLGSGTANATTRLAGDQTWKPEWTKVDKTADTSRPSTTILSADPTLTFAVAANTKYSFRFVAVVSSFNVGGIGPNLDWRLTGPAGFNNLTVDALAETAVTGSFAFFLDAYSAVDHLLTFPTGAGPRYGRIVIEGEVSNGGTAGNIAFAWAQTASSTNATIVKAGSYLEYRAMP